MTPLGHAAVSYSYAKTIPKACVAACLFGGFIPAIDFAFVLFPFFNSIHRVLTHNVFFVGLAAAGFAAYFPANRRWVFLSAWACGMIHLLVDSVLDQNPSNGLGVALFFPLSETMFHPFNLVAVQPDAEGWGNVWESAGKLWVIMLYEIPFYCLAIYFYSKPGGETLDET